MVDWKTCLFYFKIKILCGMIYGYKLVHMHVLEKICSVIDNGVFKNTVESWKPQSCFI